MDKEKDKTKKIILRIIGIVLLLAGVVCAAIGFIDMPKSFDEERMPKMWCFFVGFPSIAIGTFLIMFSAQRAINRFVVRQNIQTFNEVSKEMAPGLSNISSAMNNSAGDIPCPDCKTLNDKDAMFCKSCGKPLGVKCDMCDTINEADAKFCKSCGRPLNNKII